MQESGKAREPGSEAAPILHEADIGSGEKSPGQEETDAMIRDIPKLPDDGGAKEKAGDKAGQ